MPSSLLILVIVSMLHGATHLYTNFLNPLNPELKEFFGLQLDEEVAVFSTIYFVVYASTNLLCGFLVTRVPARVLLSIGPVINGLAVMAMSFLQPKAYGQMCGLIAIGAAGGGLYHPVGNLLITTTFPNSKGKALGIVGAGASIAFLVAPYSALTLVKSAHWTWQNVCFWYGTIGILCGIIAWFVLSGMGSRTAVGIPGDQALSESSERMRKADPKFSSVVWFAIFTIVVVAGREISSWGLSFVTRPFVEGSFTASPPNAGLLISLMFGSGLIMQPLAGRWSDKVIPEHVVALCLGIMATMMVWAPSAPQGALFPLYILMGGSLIATVPVLESLMAARTPTPLRGLVFGIVITSGFGMGATGPFLVGAVADAGHREPWAYASAFYVLAMIGCTSGIMAILLRPIARRLGLL